MVCFVLDTPDSGWIIKLKLLISDNLYIVQQESDWPLHVQYSYAIP